MVSALYVIIYAWLLLDEMGMDMRIPKVSCHSLHAGEVVVRVRRVVQLHPELLLFLTCAGVYARVVGALHVLVVLIQHLLLQLSFLKHTLVLLARCIACLWVRGPFEIWWKQQYLR